MNEEQKHRLNNLKRKYWHIKILEEIFKMASFYPVNYDDIIRDSGLIKE